jgi:nucleoside-diphosphate-sugar epimerase
LADRFMTHALVTGASGFIGSALARELVSRGSPVTCLVRRSSRLERLADVTVPLAYGDVTDRQSLREPMAGASVVYHVAGLVRALRAAELYRVNGQGVRNLLEVAAAQPQPPVVVLVSSLAAAGPAPWGRLRTDDDPICPLSHYGHSKRVGELAAEEFAGRLPITVIRPGIILGEGDMLSLPIFRAIAWTRIHFVPGYFPNRFSMMHVADLVEVLIRAAQRGKRLTPEGCAGGSAAKPGYYFAACGEHPTYYEFGRLIARAMGVKALAMPWATPVTWAVAAVSELAGQIGRRPANLGLDKAREATAGCWACSCQRMIDDLDFRCPLPLEERLSQTVAWYREHGWLGPVKQ